MQSQRRSKKKSGAVEPVPSELRVKPDRRVYCCNHSGPSESSGFCRGRTGGGVAVIQSSARDHIELQLLFWAFIYGPRREVIYGRPEVELTRASLPQTGH